MFANTNKDSKILTISSFGNSWQNVQYKEMLKYSRHSYYKILPNNKSRPKIIILEVARIGSQS